MRRSVRALSVAAVAGAALGIAVPAALAEPAAEVSPGNASPGGSVTVSVACDPTGGSPPDTIDATSQAFEEGTVRLRLVSGNDDEATGPAYNGTARIAPAENLEGDVDAVGNDSAWTVDGTCPAAPGGQGKQWSATFTVSRGSGKSCGTGTEWSHTESCATTHPCIESHTESCATTHPCTESHTDSCGGATVQRGVRAGEGGAFTDSVPALVTGGLLIAGALGGAVYRLRRKTPAAES
ncbi:hypothetical protein ADK57_00360 [Streptomyces sp. MMG1533]|uniref:hypothetical protein n=1 Tax=Streptomyces sp. MMG1533 TaxID=1415546 RepID=UPI0006AE50D7|nr:hypothetical protein [Streptomyces sp. MMG1533]KOU77906.1 hypothetical protein ADK57_00360 [Streptomyces sp. MMG1533]